MSEIKHSTIGQLIDKLEEFDPELPAFFYDGHYEAQCPMPIDVATIGIVNAEISDFDRNVLFSGDVVLI